MGLPILSPHSDPLNVYDQETFHHNEAGHRLVTSWSHGQMSSPSLRRDHMMSRSRELTQKWWLQHRGHRKIRFYWPIVPYCKLLSWIWNPPPRDLLHKQKKLGKSLGRFYVIRFVFYGAELFLGFEIPTQGKIKLLKIFLAGAPGLSEWVLCSFSLVSEKWDWKSVSFQFPAFCMYHEIMISFTS